MHLSFQKAIPMPSPQTELHALLEEAFDRYNRPDFIEEDPIQVPHLFSKKEDIEIAAFLSATIAWGRRASIIKNAHALVDRMDRDPFRFVMEANEAELERLEGFVHRTFNAVDARSLVLGLRDIYKKEGLEALFAKGMGDEQSTFGGIVALHKRLCSQPDFAERSRKHVANPARGSSAKRINMFLRWMVRDDGRGVDFGLWKTIRPSQLMMPLDVHTGTVARTLGLLQLKQNNWKAVISLTDALRRFSKDDPVRYDFSLFGLGAYNQLV
ncbi:MAG: TIGR02757 family protein [Bacteroidia bacterium]